jgi:thiol:disulfide interchange protein DsbA
MNRTSTLLAALVAALALAACSKQDDTAQTPTASPATPSEEVVAPEVAPASDATPPAPVVPEGGEASTGAPTPPSETISETDDTRPPEQTTDASSSGVQPSLRLGSAPTTAPSGRFREGTHYQKLVPAQPTSVAPGKVEIVEVFWYGCGHCFSLDPAIESWRRKGKAQYSEFVRVPAMWNDTLRMHARLFYTLEALGKLEQLHSLIFRELHVNNNPLNTVDKINAFMKQHGVDTQTFQKAFSSFDVERKLQRADVLNRRYRVQSVPMFVVNGKYTTDAGTAGGEQQLFAVLDELAAHEHGG